eukprot:gene13235-biopygen11052
MAQTCCRWPGNTKEHVAVVLVRSSQVDMPGRVKQSCGQDNAGVSNFQLLWCWGPCGSLPACPTTPITAASSEGEATPAVAAAGAALAATAAAAAAAAAAALLPCPLKGWGKGGKQRLGRREEQV